MVKEERGGSCRGRCTHRSLSLRQHTDNNNNETDLLSLSLQVNADVFRRREMARAHCLKLHDCRRRKISESIFFPSKIQQL